MIKDDNGINVDFVAEAAVDFTLQSQIVAIKKRARMNIGGACCNDADIYERLMLGQRYRVVKMPCRAGQPDGKADEESSPTPRDGALVRSVTTGGKAGGK